MKTVNKLTLLGRVGKDPERVHTHSGDVLCRFSIATDRYKGEQTDWHRCTAFGKTAEIVLDWVQKGDQLYVEGRVEYGSYEKDGETKYTTDVIVREVTLCGGRRDQGGASDGPF